jgi:FxsC-like protein
LWVPVDPNYLPEAAASIAFNHTALGEAYASEGLYGLIKLRYLRDEYERAVYGLARQIVTAAHQVSIAPGRPSDYHEMPSAFDVRSRGQRLKIVVAAARDQHVPAPLQDAYGRASADWNPYYSVTARPLALVAADLAASLSMSADVHSFEDVVDSLLDGRLSDDGPILLLLDRWALHEPELRTKLSLLDAKAPVWTRVIIPWDKGHNGVHDNAPDPVALEAVIPQLLRLGRSASRSAVSGVGTLETFCEIFPVVMGHASSAFARHTSPSPSDAHPPRPRLRTPSTFPEASGDRTP